VAVRLVEVPTFWQPLRVVAFSLAVARALRDAATGFDVVHSFARTRHQDLYRAGGGSHADYMHRAYGPIGAALRRLSPRHRVLLAAERRIFAGSDPIIQCVSMRVRDELTARFSVSDDRLVVIHNGVDPERFDPTRLREQAEKLRTLLSSEGETIWLLAGSGGRRKGIDTALEALAACRDPSAVLWIAGRDAPDPWRRLARALGLDGRVRFLGDRRDMPAVYAAADGLLLPTRYDPFANVCLEAAASALPIVTSGANGATEVVGEAAIVVDDPEDIAGFADALSKLSRPDLRRKLGERGRKIALEHGWDDHVVRLRALYDSVIARRVARGASGAVRP
jgi:UDP-glucose:(heptosyl)LPS alpha-1,3-glucosyltransferase